MVILLGNLLEIRMLVLCLNNCGYTYDQHLDYNT